MQNAFLQDMFNLGGVTSSRCNGHIPVSTSGNVSKRDRKGCKKGKIEAIMKNNMVSSKARVRLQTSPVVKKLKPFQTGLNHSKPGTVIKSEYIDSEDPYTFTETEPLSIYPGSTNLTLSRKLVPLVNNRSKQIVVSKNLNMVCVDRDSDLKKVNKLLTERLESSGNQSVNHSSKPFVTKSNKNVQNNVEGSSKTMNRLQADIARSKIIGKRKKMVVNNLSGSSWEGREIKTEPGSSHEYTSAPVFAQVTVPAKRRNRQTTWQREKKLRHEALQRIQEYQQQCLELKQDLYPLGLEVSDSENDDEPQENGRGIFQRNWFMGCVWGGVDNGMGRESRLAQVNSELRRRVCQVWRGIERSRDPPPELVTSVVDAARTHPNTTAHLLHPRLKLTTPKQTRAKVSMLVPRDCSLDCGRKALPCTKHCAQHIMYNVDQQLYQHCTAKFADNTQCNTPVFDITHHQPLCRKHGSIYDDIKLHNAARSKKSVKKKSKPAALTRSTKRGKKKKKTPSSTELSEMEMPEVEIKTEPLLDEESGHCINNMDQMMLHSSSNASEVFLTDASLSSQVEIQVQLEDAVEVVSDEVLAIASLDPTELANQASRLLEEHDITSMLNLPADLHEIFLEDKNGVYEPTREQTEGLERALEEVDKEVRSLERMTSSLERVQSLPLNLPMDSINLLDDVRGYVTYPNGFTPIAQTVQSQPDLRHS